MLASSNSLKRALASCTGHVLDSFLRATSPTLSSSHRTSQLHDTAGASWTQIATLGPNVTSYTDTGLQPSTTYFHVACAQNSAGAACASAYSSGTTLSSASTTPPTAPSNMVSTGLSSSSLKVTWQDRSEERRVGKECQ